MTMDFWQGRQGDAYIGRNDVVDDPAASGRRDMWADILSYIHPSWTDATPWVNVQSILEVGANIGRNLRAIGPLTGAELYAVEPNAEARRRLVADMVCKPQNAADGTADDIPWHDASFDLVLTCGCLIHVPPADLLASCKEIHRVSRRYIVAVEYFSKSPEMIPYRGEADRLWKRDYGAFYLDNFPDLRPIGCGFCWKRTTGLDDLTYWIFEKR